MIVWVGWCRRANERISYVYDSVGNRTSTETSTTFQSFTYSDQANRLEQVDRKDLSYDVHGNMITDRNNRREFVYDVTNRLTEFHKQGELRASYRYNAFGQRIGKTLHRPERDDDSYRTLRFSYSPSGQLLSEHGKNSAQNKTFARDFIWLGSIPLAQVQRKINQDGTTHSAQVVYLHADHLNTPRTASDEDGRIVWRWDSSAYGEGKADRDVDGDGANTVVRLRFPGQYYDHENGFYYNHHRDYDPAMGRYMQADPIGLLGGINRYAYVEANPINLIDPTGLKATAEDCTDPVDVANGVGCGSTGGGGGTGGYGGGSTGGGSTGGGSTGGGGSGGGSGSGTINHITCPTTSNTGTLNDYSIPYWEYALNFNFNGASENTLGILGLTTGQSALAFSMASHALVRANANYPGDPLRADAFRHAYWSYGMTSFMGSTIADMFGNAHEVTGHNNGQPIGQLYMDLYNNLVGQTLFSMHGNTDWQSLAVENIIMNAINANELVTQVPTSC